jgi:hypothetical protein
MARVELGYSAEWKKRRKNLRCVTILSIISFILISNVIVHIPAYDADETDLKAIISLDQSKVDVDINRTKLNFATVTGSVLIDLNETENGILQLYAKVDEFTTIVAPDIFYVDSNTSSLNFTVDTFIPEGFLGGEVRLLEVYGNLTLGDANSTIYPMESAFAMISINPVYSINIEVKDQIINVSPAKSGTFQLIITNHGHQGIFKIEIEDLRLLQENEYVVSVNPSIINLTSKETGYVNITVDLPDLWTLWTDRAVPININVTDEDGEVIEKVGGYVKVEGIYMGGFEGIFCGLVIVCIILLIIMGMVDIGTRGTKKERSEKKRLKLEKKYAKMEAKLRKKGVFLDDTNGEEKEPEPSPEPLKCPYCDSTDIKTTLSGKSKCKYCERIIEPKEDE